MPITPISLVTLALLGSGDRALSVHETQELLRPFLDEVRQRSLPTTEEIELDTPDQVAEALEHLMDHGVVSRITEGSEVLYGIQSEQHFAASFYRNTIVHFFVEDAISEIALVAAGESGDPEPAFWEEARRLRDLLKFEFFFRRRPEYRAEIARGLERRHAGWEADVASGKATDVLQELRLITAPFVLRPFLEAYRVVADELESLESAQAFDEKRFLSDAMARGRRYRLQHRVERPESMSLVLFRTALQLAANRDLLEPGNDDGRKSLASEIRRTLGRIDLIAAMTAARRSNV
jgi:glycerol-3-phosphate O-acyltransferase